jgi:hypothetical protein
MAFGKRLRERQLEAFVAASDLPKSPGHPFYAALNRLLAENGFDALVEKLCAPYYAETMGSDVSRCSLSKNRLVEFRISKGERPPPPWGPRSG